MKAPHQSVLLQEVIQSFDTIHPLHYFVDGTLGAGGHSAAILEAHKELTTLIGIDQDPTALELASQRLKPWRDKVNLMRGNFASLIELVSSLDLKKIDGMLLDIGVSSMQFDQAERGFSFTYNGPLDMRMNPEQSLTAAEVVNTYSEADIGRIFRDYGEEKQWRNAARTIIAARTNKPILTTFDLVEVLRPIFSWKKKGINPLTLIFQGLRIYVNRELEVLEQVIPEAIELLAPGARLAIISFHSLEDRIVKNAFRFAASDKLNTSGIGGLFLDKEPTVKIVTRKPLCPTEEEIANNPRCRSAKLRVVEKL